MISTFSRTAKIQIGAGLSGYIAEMAGAFVCASLGIAPTLRHADYVGCWLEAIREDDRAIVRAASAASKAPDYLLAFLPQHGEISAASATDEGEAAGCAAAEA